jgi:hypothetical protein
MCQEKEEEQLLPEIEITSDTLQNMYVQIWQGVKIHDQFKFWKCCFSNFARLYNISTPYRGKIKGRANLTLPCTKKE